MTTRLVPLVSVFAAFSFVVMMFNLPLPGGTTGHAVGMGIATIVLGPWAAMLSVSVALLIQAVFFGDGGITAIGANCFNMGIAGCLVAYAVYRILGRGAGIGSARRVVAAGMAGYAGINVSALLAAIEFGIQPMFFRDASGAPLYCPYPLSVSIPAMMVGHLTFAGFAEMVVTAGVVKYLQNADPALLKQTAPDAPDRDAPLYVAGEAAWPTARKLWVALAIVLVLTPIGILAAGSAWGEWAPQDFADPSLRQQISAASGNRKAPDHAPQGLERLSSFWTAPLSRYAPGFIRSASFGYLVSAMVGVGLIIFSFVAITWILGRTGVPATVREPDDVALPKGGRSRSFIEGTVTGLLAVMEHALYAEEISRANGFLQGFDPRVKLAGLLTLIAAAAAVRKLPVLIGLFVLAIVLAVLSRVPVRTLATRVWIAVLGFTGVIALPAIFITPGEVIWRLPFVAWPITLQGLASAGYLILRVETAATFSILLVLCTPWMQVLRSLRFFRVPVVAVVILGMTYRYIFLLLQTAHDMFEARRSRLVGVLTVPERRRLAAASAGVLLGKSIQLSSEVHTAMLARGFRGEVHLLEDLKMHPGDWVRLGAFLGVASIALWLGR